MSSFTYIIETNRGNITRKKIRANNLNHARILLKERKLTPLLIKENLDMPFWQKLFQEKRVKTDEIIVFSQLFAGTIQVGLTIKDALNTLALQIENKVLKTRLNEILVDLEAGTALSDCFKKHTDIFPQFYPMLIKTGELSGDLAGVLEYMSDYLDRLNTLKKEIIGLFTYPVIVTTMGVGLVGLILTFVAPTFKDVFSKIKLDLPVPTQILFVLSDLIINYQIPLLLFFALLILSFLSLKQTYRGRKLLDLITIRAPIIGIIFKDTMTLRFIKTFDILVNNNVPMLQALQVLESSTSNLNLKEIITDMRKDVSKGLPMSGPLIKRPDIISSLVSYTVSTGEKSGNLGPLLTKMSFFVDKEIGFSMKKLSARLDPLLTLGLGIMVLFVALAIYLPIFDMITQTAT